MRTSVGTTVHTDKLDATSDSVIIYVNHLHVRASSNFPYNSIIELANQRARRIYVVPRSSTVHISL